MSTPSSSASSAKPDPGAEPGIPKAPPAPDREREEPGILWAVALDGKGGGQAVDPSSIPDLLGQGTLWVHLHREWEGAEAWLKSVAKAPKMARRDLLAGRTRPDVAPLGEGILVNLRGVNLNPGADPEDMVALRLWVTGHLVVTARARSVMAVRDVRAQLKHGYGPQDSGAVVAALAQALSDRMSPFLLDLSDAIDDMDARDEVLGLESTDKDHDLEEQLHQARLDIVGLRRYLAPQQAALTRLAALGHPVLNSGNRELLSIALAGHTRHLEDLDTLREQAALLRDRIQQRGQERMNRAVYRMSLLAGIFLPLTFITGLLGVNLGGIPGAGLTWGFWVLCGILVALVGAEWLYLRRSDKFRG